MTNPMALTGRTIIVTGTGQGIGRAISGLVLELGGNAGAIVHKDADVGWAAERCATGGFGHAGQVCIKVQRVYVHASVHDSFMSTLLRRVQALKVGDPLDPATEVGPLIDDAAAAKR